jgi:hypothetical protein
MGEMRRAIAREQVAWAEQMQEQTRMKSTLVIAAAIIAAVRLARDPDNVCLLTDCSRSERCSLLNRFPYAY